MKTLKGKLSFVYLTLVIFIAIVGVTSFYNLYILSKSIDGLITDNYKSINATFRMFEAIERQDNAILTYISGDSQKAIDMFTQNNELFLKWYNIENNNVTEQGEQSIVLNIKSNYLEYTKLFSTLQEIRVTQGEDKALSYYNKTIVPQFTKVKEALFSLSSINEDAMFNSKDRATKNAEKSTYIIIAVTLFAIIGGFALSRQFTARFLKPVTDLTETMKELKSGSRTIRAEVQSKDEIGILASELNNLIGTLQQYEQSTLGRILNEKNRTMAIVKSISDPLIVLDTNFRMVLINNACEKFFGIKEERATNRHFLEELRNGELFDFISTGGFNRENVDNSKGSEPHSREKIISITVNNEEWHFNTIVTAVYGDNGIPIGIIVLMQNVTQLKNLEKVRTDFIATISHELKTPLTSIVMGTDMMLNENIGTINIEQQDVLYAIKEDSDRLSTLVNDLLELTKIESEKAIYKFENCHIEKIIDSSAKQFIQQSQRKEISLIIECENHLPLIRADQEKITWVINNLVSNALKYTNAGDEIRISASVLNNKMKVTVKDTGAGIPEEYIDKIFNKFVQVKDGDIEVRGTGLGLSVVKDIILAHGGTIKCESTLDVGSSFSFMLDLY